MRSFFSLALLLIIAACDTANQDEICRYYGNCEEEKSAECSVWGNCKEDKAPECSVWGNCKDDEKEDNGCTIYGCPDDKKQSGWGW